MSSKVTIRIKMGDMEVEVTGPKVWCETQIKKIVQWYKRKKEVGG